MLAAAAPLPFELKRMECPLCGGRQVAFERFIHGFSVDRCRSCTFVFMNPRYADEDAKKLYCEKGDVDRLIELYSRMATPSIIDEYRGTLRKLTQLLPSKGRLLDYGCAAGYFFEQAIQDGWDAHGVDIGEWTAEAAHRRGVPNLHVGSLQDLDLPEASFDVVYISQVIEHLPTPSLVLKELFRLLKPGGLLWVTVPNYHTLSIMTKRDDFYLNAPPQHVNFFTPRTLVKLLRDCSFSVRDTFTCGGLKWESFLGRPIVSDIASAYDTSNGPNGQTRTQSTSSIKMFLRTCFVTPVLYRFGKLGIQLEAIAYRPAT